MLRILRRETGAFETVAPGADWTLPDDALWIDLCDPSREEEVAIEQALRLELPTREEMAEIEPSSRLYQDHGATFMTAAVLTRSDQDTAASEPVTFVLTQHRLITIRYGEPRAFAAYAAQLARQPAQAGSGVLIFLGLLDAVVDRLADVLERTSAEIEKASKDVFHRGRGAAFEPVLHALGRAERINAKARESLVSLARLLSFAALADAIDGSGDCRDHLKSLQRDVASLTDHASYLSGNVTFLLDAALGLINIEQNGIIKIFSVAAVVFMPPTLVASVFGMNFHFMPELSWRFGYPAALVLMIVSAVVPLWFFKRKGWL